MMIAIVMLILKTVRHIATNQTNQTSRRADEQTIRRSDAQTLRREAAALRREGRGRVRTTDFAMHEQQFFPLDYSA